MFYLKTLYTTIMYQVKFFLTIFLVAFFNISAVSGQTISPNNEIQQNYWAFIEPVLRCQVAHQFMVQQTLDYSYMLGFFRNEDPNGTTTVESYMVMTQQEVEYLEIIKGRLKEAAVPSAEYEEQARVDVIKEMLNIERELQTKYFIEWYQSRSISNVGEFQTQLKKTLTYCIQQRQKWSYTLDSNSL